MPDIASRTTSDSHCSDKIEAQNRGHTLITTEASPVDKQSQFSFCCTSTLENIGVLLKQDIACVMTKCYCLFMSTCAVVMRFPLN